MICVAPVEVVRLMTHFLPLVTFQQHPQQTHLISASHHCEKILSSIRCYKQRVSTPHVLSLHRMYIDRSATDILALLKIPGPVNRPFLKKF